MTDEELIQLAMRYFTVLDDRDSDALANILAEDCVLRIETHDITHHGRAAIRSLFAARWEVSPDMMVKARHHDFTHSPSASCGRIASQFTVTYSGPAAPEPKSNANVFSMRDGKITGISVYMAGANSIKS
ncbi:MAG: nuclear transport factor 2 family protein [Alphaproteobacteria bacterium]|jgi:ketosteroid isomerase-like protein|nr:nuclear transport factor 2 family protein [Alphaproteobacteria bacterium]